MPDGQNAWPDWLRKIDTRLEDEAVIEVVARGPGGTLAEVVIRMLILRRHLFDWSDDDLEREVRANLVYRTFKTNGAVTHKGAILSVLSVTRRQLLRTLRWQQ